jgi:hypothetical protein
LQLAAKVIKLKVFKMLKCEILHKIQLLTSIFKKMLKILDSVVQEIKNSYDYRRARIPSK